MIVYWIGTVLTLSLSLFFFLRNIWENEEDVFAHPEIVLVVLTTFVWPVFLPTMGVVYLAKKSAEKRILRKREEQELDKLIREEKL